MFATLTKYTKNAQKYLENIPIIRGVNGTEFVDLILKFYEQLSEKYRKKMPLKIVYNSCGKSEYSGGESITCPFVGNQEFVSFNLLFLRYHGTEKSSMLLHTADAASH